MNNVDELTLDILDNIEILESTLLEYERKLATQQADIRTVHIMFRYAHNTKGGLALANNEACAELVHWLETGLDKVRNGVFLLEGELLEVSLRCVSCIRDELTGEGDSAERLVLVEALKRIVEPGGSGVGASEGQSQLVAVVIGAEASKRVEGTLTTQDRLVQITKILSGNVSRATYDSLPIFDVVAQIGTLVEVRPPFKELDPSANEHVIEILFTTSIPHDDLEFKIFDPMKELPVPESWRARDLPAVVQTTTADAPADTSPRRPRALIVEDELVSRMILTKQLGKQFECETAVDGLEGLVAFLLSYEEGAPFDLICLDINLPVMPGGSLLRIMRQVEGERGIPLGRGAQVLMVTGDVSPTTVLGSFKKGCEGYIPKPIDPKQLRTTLAKLGFSEVVG